MEEQGTGRHTDLRLSSMREDTRQAATVADGRLRGPVAAWNWRPRGPFLATCCPAFLRGAVAGAMAEKPLKNADPGHY